MSMLKKYVFNASHVLYYEPLEVPEDLTYEKKKPKMVFWKENSKSLHQKDTFSKDPVEESCNWISIIGARRRNDFKVSTTLSKRLDYLIRGRKFF